ncbi:partner of Y14 and mago-like [Wolffia australiana]
MAGRVGKEMAAGEGSAPPPRSLGWPAKEGERIIAPTRRPDGTLRKPVRIRAGYVPQDEVAIYQSKGALLKKAAQSEGPPGYDPDLDGKPKTKTAKRNERRKAKKSQAVLASTEEVDQSDSEARQVENGMASVQGQQETVDILVSVVSRITEVSFSEASSPVVKSQETEDTAGSAAPVADLDKKIRAIKKKIRLAEQFKGTDPQSLKPEQREKLSKIQGWLEELRLLEQKKPAHLP